MRLISHRGNIEKANSSLENNPKYIEEALEEGFDVEIDVWLVNDRWYLGHDNPEYIIEQEYFQNDKFWCHAKNITALSKMVENKIHCFWHQEDFVTLTSRGYLWTYPGQELTSKSICVLPEMFNSKIETCFGICSDEIIKYR